jgi:uncharacterized protein (DUF2252 family)
VGDAKSIGKRILHGIGKGLRYVGRGINANYQAYLARRRESRKDNITTEGVRKLFLKDWANYKLKKYGKKRKELEGNRTIFRATFRTRLKKPLTKSLGMMNSTLQNARKSERFTTIGKHCSKRYYFPSFFAKTK